MKQNKRKHQATLATAASEPMVNARQASCALCMPYYWFSDRTMRAAKRLPHYLLGGLIRFRLSELHAWAKSFPVAQTRKEVS